MLRRTGMLLVAVPLVMLSCAVARPHECEWKLVDEGVTGRASEQVRTSCRVRTLSRSLLTEGEGNASLSALVHATHVTALTLQCARRVIFESEVTAGMFSVFPRLEDLQILGCKVTDLPPLSLAGLPHLRRFVLRAYHRDWPGASLAIHPDAFAGLNRLESLDLSHNTLWSLPSAVFCHLHSLATLNLTQNRLHHLPDLGLGGLGPQEEEEEEEDPLPPECPLPLQQLDLSHNQVAEIPERAFNTTGDLKTLSLHHNRLARLSDWAFGGLLELRSLDLSHNRLVALPRSALSDLRQLRELSIANNSLGVLPPVAFGSLGQLLTLNLSHNQLVLGPSSVEPFTGLIRLVVLDVSYNHLVHLGPDTFRDLYSLQVLRLTHNRLRYLSDATFAGLANLHTLELTHNELNSLSGRALQGLAVLTHLTLDHNNLETVHKAALDNCTSLHYLSLAHNELTALPGAVTRAQLLRRLDVSHNQISHLEEGVFQGLAHLQDLHLAGNQLTNVSRASLAEVPSLSYLDISGNYLTSIEYGVLEATPKLAGLDLHSNGLEDISGFVTLQNLTWLNVSHNSIGRFDYALVPKSLEWLDLSHNRVSELENYYEVQKTLGLRVLYASHNNISDIGAAAVPDGLEELHLECNSISYVAPNTFLEKKSVSLVDLRDNNLTILEEAALRLSPRQGPPPLLLLSRNPLRCDCVTEWLLSAAEASLGSHVGGASIVPRLGDAAAVLCRLPGLWDGALVPLVTVRPKQFLCTYQRHCFTLCHCCDFDACDCEQTCPANCTCYHDHTWTHNVVDCGTGWSQMPSGVPMDVTEAFMDGNSMGALTPHALIGRKNLRVLHLNHSEITSIQNRTFIGLMNLYLLRLDHNRLAALHGFEFVDLRSLRELYLHDNNLRHLSNVSFSPLRAIELLRLENNLLTTFPVWNLALNPFLLEVSLHHNPWSCECDYLANLRAWLDANRIKTTNASLIRCQHTSSGVRGPPVLSDTHESCDHYVATTRINSLIVHDYVMLLLITAALLFALFAAAVVAVAYRRRLRLWAVSRYGKRVFEKTSSYVERREKLFDAFVTHSAKDSHWVCGLMAPELEASGYRLCVAHRDCAAPHAPVSGRTISESVACSRRVVVVLSRNFMSTEWCRSDLRTAHADALRLLKRRGVIVVALERVPKSELDRDLVAIADKAGATLNPRDPGFWAKFRRAMPSLQSRPGLSTPLKAASRPLVTPDHHRKGGPPKDHTPFAVSPYWEAPLARPPWPHIPIKPPSPPDDKGGGGVSSPSGSIPEHTYMSVSECGELGASAHAPNHLAHSWIFHPPPSQPSPPSGQTYFV